MPYIHHSFAVTSNGACIESTGTPQVNNVHIKISNVLCDCTAAALISLTGSCLPITPVIVKYLTYFINKFGRRVRRFRLTTHPYTSHKHHTAACKCRITFFVYGLWLDQLPAPTSDDKQAEFSIVEL